MLLLDEVQLLLRDPEQKMKCGASYIKTRLHVFRMF